MTSWSQINNVYQINIATTNQVIEDFLNSPHNTWNYPSPNSDAPALLTVPVFPDPSISPPAFLTLLIANSPPIVPITPASPTFVATLPNFLEVLADVTAQQDYLPSPQLQYPDPEPQDAYIYQQFEEVIECVLLADIPVKNLPLSQAQLAPSRVPAKSRTSPSKPALKPSYSHVVKQGLKIPTCDPGNMHVMKSCAPPVLQVSRVTPRDPGKQESCVTTRDPGKPDDLPRDWSSARPRDVTRFRRATCPLISMWKTVGQSTVDRRINKVTRLSIVTHAQSAVNAAQH